MGEDNRPPHRGNIIGRHPVRSAHGIGASRLMVRGWMVARVAVIPGVDVLDPITGRVPIITGLEIWGAPSREAGSGVCAVSIGMGGRTRRCRRLTDRCCLGGPISILNWRGRAIRRVKAQTRAIYRLRRRFALCTRIPI
jgi:hypothetical protein